MSSFGPLGTWTIILLAGAALSACGVERPPQPGVQRDAQAMDATDAREGDGGTLPDASLRRDAAEPRDAAASLDASVAPDALSVDGSLSGTPLENLQIVYDAPLTLCDRWIEGGTLAEGRARQVRLELPPQPRAGLEPAQLAAARFAHGLVQTDPYASGTWILEHESITSSLTEWTLTREAAATRLRATVTHGLGAAGLLSEQIDVRRADGDRSPVRYTADSPEVSFQLVRPGGVLSYLGPCGGDADLEDAVVAAAFTRGNDVLTVFRAQRTRLALAGSAPVYPTAAAVHLWRGATVLEQQAETFFAQTYTAQHHNWQEHSAIDFTRDRRWTYLVFDPLARGEQVQWPADALERIELIGLGSSGVPGARAEVTRIEPATSTRHSETFSAAGDWRRVDSTELTRLFNLASCGTLKIASYYDYQSAGLARFTLAGCVGSGPLGFEVRGFVPLEVPAAPELTGRAFSGGAIRTLASGLGLEIDLGTHKVEVTNGGGFGVGVRLLSAQGSPLTTGTAYESAIFDGGIGDERLEAATADRSIRAVLDRRWLFQGAGNSSIFGPLSFSLTFAGSTHRVVAWDRLRYENTHHNWEDTLVAETPELRMEWRVLSFGGDVSVRVVQKAGGQEILPSTTLTRVP